MLPVLKMKERLFNGINMMTCTKCNIGNYSEPYIGSNARFVIVSESPASATTLLTPDKSDF